MKLKINQFYRPEKQWPGESVFDRNRRIGARTIKTMGMIGQGTKVHKFTVEVVDTGKGLGIVSVWSLCGSAKWVSTIDPIFDDTLTCTCKKCENYVTIKTTKTKEEKTMAKANVTVKMLKEACDLINGSNLRDPKDPIRVGERATKAQVQRVFLVALEEIDKAGKLDDVPEKAWDVYLAVKPADDTAETTTTIDYDDTPEGKAEKAATKADAKAAAKAAKAKAAAKPKAKKATAETKPEPKKKFTKAVAFWACLKALPKTTKADLAECLREAHGNGSEAEAKFWTQNYLNLLVEAGLVEIDGKNVTFIER